MSLKTTPYTDIEKKAIFQRFKNELERVQNDSKAVDNRLNTFLSIFARRFGPAIGSHLPFFAITIRNEVDFVTFVTWFAISVISFLLVKYNYEWVEGEHGQLEYLSELLKILNEAINEGVAISEEDVDAQDDWLMKYVKGDGIKITKDHPVHVRSPMLRKRIRKCNKLTLTFLAVAIGNFILNTLPSLTPSMEERAKGIGRFFEFLPEYMQWIYLNVFRPEVSEVITQPCPL